MIGLLCSCSAIESVRADAFVVTKAMNATTIAEIFIDEKVVRVNLEIGVSDLPAFRDVLPQEMLVKIGANAESADNRAERFFRQGFVIQADGESPLSGSVESLVVRKRIVRDEITGDPIAEQPVDAESVVVTELAYQLDGKPTRLSIRPPSQQERGESANIGFVAYHSGLAVNDFRYLPSEATLDLDWEDPWYSRFRNRNLWRQNAAPMSAYLYVEPFEVRKEIIIRPQDLKRFLDLDLDDSDVIPVDLQQELKRRISEFLANKNPVMIDGQAKPGQLDRIHFVRRTLRRTGIVDPPEDLDAKSATLGVIFVYPIEELPTEVKMEWELFDDMVQSVPSAASDEAGPLPSILTPDDPVLLWRNFLKNPTSHRFADIAPPPPQSRLSIPVITLVCAVSLFPLGLACWRKYKQSGVFVDRLFLVWIAIAVFGAATFPFSRATFPNPFSSPPKLSATQAEELLAGLLHNVYRAFDRRDPSLVYDRLARSIAGDLLEQVYLETRKTIEIENQGGLQIKVNDVSILDLEFLAATSGQSTYRVHWRVAGSVGHWGHVHSRANEPSAEITLAPVDGSWKIIAMQMTDALQEESR